MRDASAKRRERALRTFEHLLASLDCLCVSITLPASLRKGIHSIMRTAAMRRVSNCFWWSQLHKKRFVILSRVII